MISLKDREKGKKNREEMGGGRISEGQEIFCFEEGAEIEAWELVPSMALMDPMLSSQCVAFFKP